MAHGPTSLTGDAAVADAIGKAVRHAERISKREHILADRVERVNLFLTSLRRELGYLDRHGQYPADTLVASLCHKELWHDAGVLNINIGCVHGVKFSRDQIQRWLDLANRQRNSTEAARYQIEGDLEELERGLTGALTAVAAAREINQESEVVASGLCQLFE